MSNNGKTPPRPTSTSPMKDYSNRSKEIGQKAPQPKAPPIKKD